MIDNIFNRIPSFNYQLALIVISAVVLGVASAFVSPWYVLAGIVSIALFLLIVKMPELGIFAVIVFTSTLLSTDANPGFAIGIGHIYLTDILLFTLLALVGIRGLAKHPFNWIGTPLDFPLLAFIGISFLSTFLAIAKSSLTLQQSLGEIRNIGNYLTFFAVTNLLQNQRTVKVLTNALLVLASLVAIAMVVQYVLGPNTLLLPGRIETLSTEGASYSGVTRIIPPGYSLVFIAFIFLSVKQTCDDRPTFNLWLLVSWILTGLGVVLTFKRHFWVASIVVFLLILFLVKKKELKRIFGWTLSVLAISVIGLFLAFITIDQSALDLIGGSIARLDSLTNADTYLDPNSSLRWRDFEYEYAAPQIIAHPILGLGLGALYRPFVPFRDNAGFDGRGFVHNAHIYIMVKMGLLGYFAMVCLIILFVYRGLRYWRKLTNTDARVIVLGFTLAYIGMLMGSIVEPMLIEWRWTALLGVMMGLTESTIRLSRVHHIPASDLSL